MFQSLGPEEALAAVASLAWEVKKVDGTFVTIFSNELIGGESKINWKALYSIIVKNVYV